MMEYLRLRNGFMLPKVGIGTFPLMGDQLFETLRIAAKCGYELVDTAAVYHNESEIGRCIKEGVIDRDKIVLSSKVNSCQLRGRIRYLFLDRESVRSAYMHSCKRLGVEQLDLFLLHQPFSGFEKAYVELQRLYGEGKVRTVGVSNCDIDELKWLKQHCGEYPMINQTEISPRNSFKDLVHFCQDNDIVVEAYSPFGRGNLVAELLSDERLLGIAQSHNKSVGQVVLRWIVQQGMMVIPRSSNASRIQENLNIFDFELSDEEMSIVDSMNQNRVFGFNQVNKYR